MHKPVGHDALAALLSSVLDGAAEFLAETMTDEPDDEVGLRNLLDYLRDSAEWDNSAKDSQGIAETKYGRKPVRVIVVRRNDNYGAVSITTFHHEGRLMVGVDVGTMTADVPFAILQPQNDAEWEMVLNLIADFEADTEPDTEDDEPDTDTADESEENPFAFLINAFHNRKVSTPGEQCKRCGTQLPTVCICGSCHNCGQEHK